MTCSHTAGKRIVTRAVLAGAYSGGIDNAKALLLHAVEVDDDGERAICRGVKPENIHDVDDPRLPTCARCLARLLRMERAENKRLRKLVAAGRAVVEDFMPNVRNCVLKDYGRLNRFLVDAGALSDSQEGGL